jgi:ribulose-5-phosphate 4-epimerase/fuculose-1-phosphate aldolase
MADGSLMSAASLKGKVSEEEWNTRVELAALYRLVALHGWDDMIFTHISARLPGPDHHFLINPYGMYFGEMTASALVKIDLDGNILQDTPYFINPAGFTIHSAIVVLLIGLKSLPRVGASSFAGKFAHSP